MKKLNERRGSAMILSMWMVLVLACITITFGHSRIFEHRTCNNAVAAMQAQMGTDSALVYVQTILTAREKDNHLPDPEVDEFIAADIPVGNVRCWLVGRPESESEPGFGLIDEASKLNLNTATQDMLKLLPGMTDEIAAAIIDWRDANTTPVAGGAEDESYSRLDRPYRCKNGPFETVGELALVYGVTPELLYGKDRNLNGIIDPWEGSETDTSVDEPAEKFGLYQFLTVYSREPTVTPDGEARININKRNNSSKLQSYMTEQIGAQKAQSVITTARPGRTQYKSLLAFFMASGLSVEDFAKIDDRLGVWDNEKKGLVNINTAPREVLMCIPGITEDNVEQIIAYRTDNPEELDSVAWLTSAIDKGDALKAGPYLTTNSYQFTADVVAVGEYGRGFRRTAFVVDAVYGQVACLHRQDRHHLAWPLGQEVRETLARTQTNE